MPSSTPNQMFAAATAQWEGQLALWTGLAGKTIDNIEKIAKLNLSTAKSAVDDAVKAGRQFVLADRPGDYLSLTVAQTQPHLEKELSYGSQVASIASDMSAALIETAQAQITETGHTVETVIKEMANRSLAK